MLHKNRSYLIADYSSMKELVSSLHGRTWTGCSGFRCGSLTLLNDSTSGDSAQEYAVIRNGIQIESLTVSWMDFDSLLSLLINLDTGVEPGVPSSSFTITPHPEGTCYLCA